MAFTSTDLDAVDAALASGELAVEVNGKRITYRSVDELVTARRLISAELAAATNTTTVRRGAYRVRFSTARGD